MIREEKKEGSLAATNIADNESTGPSETAGRARSNSGRAVHAQGVRARRGAGVPGRRTLTEGLVPRRSETAPDTDEQPPEGESAQTGETATTGEASFGDDLGAPEWLPPRENDSSSAVQRSPAASSGDSTATDSTATGQAAAKGVSGSGGEYPHRDRIESALGQPVTARAHTDDRARAATASIGAQAYAMGDRVAFASSTPDLHTAAHEAVHTLQQKQGVQLKGGVGEAGDRHEQQADDIADKVVRGEAAGHLLGRSAGGSHGQGVQLKPASAGGAKPEYSKDDERFFLYLKTIAIFGPIKGGAAAKMIAARFSQEERVRFAERALMNWSDANELIRAERELYELDAERRQEKDEKHLVDLGGEGAVRTREEYELFLAQQYFQAGISSLRSFGGAMGYGIASIFTDDPRKRVQAAQTAATAFATFEAMAAQTAKAFGKSFARKTHKDLPPTGVQVPMRPSGPFGSAVEYTTTTGKQYKVFQRTDINWKHRRTSGPKEFIGKTNEAAARKGHAPQLPDGSFATLHHSQQSSIGPWFELSTKTHNIQNAKRSPLHPFGGGQHPFFPMGKAGTHSPRDFFQIIEGPQYWKWRESNR